MARQRNYKAEYQARLARGQKLGLTPSQASGHPKKNETKASHIIARIKRSNPQLAAPARKTPTKTKAQKLAEGYRKGKTAKVKVKQDTKTHAGQGTERTVDLALWEGQKLSRMAAVIQNIAASDPNAKIRITLIDKDGFAHTIYQNNGRRAIDLQKAIDAFMENGGGDFRQFIEAEWDNVYHLSEYDFREEFVENGSVTWEIAALPSAA